jgi:hypothetical protein
VAFAGGAGPISGEYAGVNLMGNFPVPDAEKKRARNSRSNSSIKEALLRPKTWKIALSILEVILKMVRVGAKIWDMFG